MVFDDEDNAVVMTGIQPFSTVSGKVRIGSTEFPVPFDSGRLYLNLNTSTGGLPVFDNISQGVITSSIKAFGEFSVGVQATELDSACDPLANILLPLPGNP